MEANLVCLDFDLADGQDIYTWRHYRLHERTPRQNQPLATRNWSEFKRDGHFQGCKTKWGCG